LFFRKFYWVKDSQNAWVNKTFYFGSILIRFSLIILFSWDNLIKNNAMNLNVLGVTKNQIKVFIGVIILIVGMVIFNPFSNNDAGERQVV
jgi:hypothetical protein